jgi:hypothetical protein
MRKEAILLSIALGLTLSVGAGAQSNDLAGGNLHFNPKDMDANRDNMISRDEFMAYGAKLWGMMSDGASTISVDAAAQDFARGNMRFNAKAMDTDHDGTISKEEFMTYGGKRFDMLKGRDGMLSVADATWNFARGNLHANDSKAAAP